MGLIENFFRGTKGAIIVLTLIVSISGCSVYMAASGDREPNLSAFGIGSTRGQVEQQLGAPKESITLPNGNREDTYRYVIGNESSPGRAVAHCVADILTLCIWEIFGTPIEASSQGEEKHIRITYGADNKVMAIN